MHLKYAEMLAIVVHENMKPGDNTPEWREALTISDKNLTNCSSYFTENLNELILLKLVFF